MNGLLPLLFLSLSSILFCFSHSKNSLHLFFQLLRKISFHVAKISIIICLPISAEFTLFRISLYKDLGISPLTRSLNSNLSCGCVSRVCLLWLIFKKCPHVIFIMSSSTPLFPFSFMYIFFTVARNAILRYFPFSEHKNT